MMFYLSKIVEGDNRNNHLYILAHSSYINVNTSYITFTIHATSFFTSKSHPEVRATPASSKSLLHNFIEFVTPNALEMRGEKKV